MPRRLAPLRVRDVMTRDVVSVAPGTSVKTAAGILADRGFAALPVVDDEHRLVGIVGEVDVLRGRLLPDPRLRLRRDVGTEAAAPPVHVGGAMTTDVRTVEAGADVADVARLLVDEGLRSVPVVDGGRLVGIVSRPDVLRGLAGRDDQLRGDLLRRIADYAGASTAGRWRSGRGWRRSGALGAAPDPTTTHCARWPARCPASWRCG